MNQSPKSSGGLMIRFAREALHCFTGTASCCRFTPTCSRYAREAVARYGWLKGSFMALSRVARCSPLGGYGYDPVG